MTHKDAPRVGVAISADTAFETFDRAPVPAVSLTSGPGLATAPPSHLVSLPGRNEEAEKEWERRQQDLDGDEELARQLTAQLRLTSCAEHDTAASEERLPRVGDSRPAAAPPDSTANHAYRDRDRHSPVDDTNYGV